MTKPATFPNGMELLDHIAEYLTLDALLDRNPHAIPYTEEELLRIVQLQRADRATFNIKQEAAKNKKAGIEDSDANEED